MRHFWWLFLMENTWNLYAYFLFIPKKRMTLPHLPIKARKFWEKGIKMRDWADLRTKPAKKKWIARESNVVCYNIFIQKWKTSIDKWSCRISFTFKKKHSVSNGLYNVLFRSANHLKISLNFVQFYWSLLLSRQFMHVLF